MATMMKTLLMIILKKGYNGINGTSLDVKVKDLLVPNEGPYYTPLTFSAFKARNKIYLF